MRGVLNIINCMPHPLSFPILYMLNSNGIEFRNEQGIFPLIVFEANSRNFKCIGTSFFINALGIFVTAKHVIIDELNEDNMIFVVQNLIDDRTVTREITNLCIHPYADIAVGLVGKARDPLTAEEVPFELAPSCRLSFKKMATGTELMGFGYPKTMKVTNSNLYTFSFKGAWSKGIVEDYYPNGLSFLTSKCYQTNMLIESGCSGGPIFNNGYVVGINSTSFKVPPEESPISFITPVEYLLDLQLPIEGELMSIKQMAGRDMVVVEV